MRLENRKDMAKEQRMAKEMERRTIADGMAEKIRMEFL